MALLVPHLIDAVSTDADALRRALQTLSPGQISAVLGTTDLKVTTSGGMVSVIAAGKGLALNSQNVITGGTYGLANDASVSQTHSTSDPTNPRNDLVGIKIEDAFYSGTNKQATPVIVTGTPAPSPADPTPPANWLPCARVRVNAGASTLGTITDLRAFVFQTFLPGSNGVHFRDAANARDNVQWDDAGLVTLRNALSIPPTAGGVLPTTSYGTVPVKIADLSPSGVSTTGAIAVPSWANHIQIKGQARSDLAAAFTDVGLQFNGDAGSNYSFNQLVGNNNAASSGAFFSGSAASLARIPAATGLANSGGTFQIDIFDPAGTTFIHEAHGLSGSWESGVAAGAWTLVRVLHWNVATAITTFVLNVGGNFVTGSRIRVYAYP
jgi:hypothetical protein